MMTEAELKDYLDEAIRWWRNERHGALITKDGGRRMQADHYIDAYQAVRMTVFNETLPLECNG